MGKLGRCNISLAFGNPKYVPSEYCWQLAATAIGDWGRRTKESLPECHPESLYTLFFGKTRVFFYLFIPSRARLNGTSCKSSIDASKEAMNEVLSFLSLFLAAHPPSSTDLSWSPHDWLPPKGREGRGGALTARDEEGEMVTRKRGRLLPLLFFSLRVSFRPGSSFSPPSSFPGPEREPTTKDRRRPTERRTDRRRQPSRLPLSLFWSIPRRPSFHH